MLHVESEPIFIHENGIDVDVYTKLSKRDIDNMPNGEISPTKVNILSAVLPKELPGKMPRLDQLSLFQTSLLKKPQSNQELLLKGDLFEQAYFLYLYSLEK